MRSLCIVPLLFAAGAWADPPRTPKQAVTDTYHGTRVIDEYRWLEDGSADAVKTWTKAQNAHAREYLDALPGSDKIRARLREVMAAETVSHSSITEAGGKVFAKKRQPPKEQPFLVVMPSVNEPGKARVLLDPAEIDENGTTAIDWFVPSPDGTLIAVSLSKGGSESGDVHIYDVATGEEKYEVIPRVNGGTAGGDLAWTADGKGFFYTRYPREGERPAADMDFHQQLYFHTLGEPTEEDRYEIGKDFPRIAEIRVELDGDTGRALVTVQDGDSGRFAFHFREPDGDWKQFSEFGDGIVQATFGPGDSVIAVSRAGSPRGKILRLAIPALDAAAAAVIVPEGEDTVVTDFYGYFGDRTVIPTEDRLYVLYQLGGPSEVRVFDLSGKPLGKPEQMPVSTVGGLGLLDGDLLFTNESFVKPTGVFVYRAGSGKTEELPLAEAPPVTFDDVRVEREFATSKDGTKVPVNVLIPEGADRDGSNPCLVTGYGGYNISVVPRFNPGYRVLFDRGFVVAVANLRGGGEYGEEWHRGGNLTNKQNVFDDFAAALKHMIDRQYTKPEKLGIQGGSNGGLLMGATMTQHPELLGAVVSFVGIYDMLRVELSPNGAFNIPEFGTVKDPAHFKAMRAYSPYHNVSDGADYPPVLFLTGENDPRVDPMQSRKMTARLQAASESPVLLRTDPSAGHGGDTALSAKIEEYTDVYAFLFKQLGVTDAPE